MPRDEPPAHPWGRLRRRCRVLPPSAPRAKVRRVLEWARAALLANLLSALSESVGALDLTRERW